MKEYFIPIGKDEELSKKVQEALFSAGFAWHIPHAGTYLRDDIKFIWLNSCSLRGGMVFKIWDGSAENCYVVSPYWVLEHAHELDGASPKPDPIKEMTVNEISKELGYKVKIVGKEN
jgi:hypothetical protein